jgi:hypothetical protein
MDRMKEITVEMGDVVKEMGDHMPKGLFGHHVFLPAILTKMSLHDGATVKTILFFPLRYVRQRNFFLKISTKNTRFLSFSLVYN